MGLGGSPHLHKHHLLVHAFLSQAIQSQSWHERQVRAAAALKLKGNLNYLCALKYSPETLLLSLLLSCIRENRPSATQRQFFSCLGHILALRNVICTVLLSYFHLKPVSICSPRSPQPSCSDSSRKRKPARRMQLHLVQIPIDWRYKSYHGQTCQIAKLLSLSTGGLQPAIFILLVDKWLLYSHNSERERNTGLGDLSSQWIISSLVRRGTFALDLIYMLLAIFSILLTSKEIPQYRH